MHGIRFVALLLALVSTGNTFKTEQADLILYNGRITTMEPGMPAAEAVAIKNDVIIGVGSTREILGFTGSKTVKIDLRHRRVIPGLIDNHVHPLSAAQSEYKKELPDIGTIDQLFAWIRKESKLRKPGEWIVHPKFFFTRLKEKRWPTLAELDTVAPDNPVFLNGSYAGMINTKGLEISDIVRLNDRVVVREPLTALPTGLIKQGGFRYLNAGNASPLTEEEKQEALKKLFSHYNANGITSICAGNGYIDDLNLLNELYHKGQLTVRVFQNISFPFDARMPAEKIREALKRFQYKTGDGNSWVKVGALKVVLDGGILTGTAYMGMAWGDKARKLYGFPDPSYRGELNLSKEQLVNVITGAIDAGWKFAAHVTGGAGVDTLLAAYRDANLTKPLRGGRHSVIHGNFFSKDAIRTMADLDIYADVQPIWFYKDVGLLNEVLGAKRMEDFHPYQEMLEAKVLLNGGSDHMVKLDADRAINPYNPFQAMWTVITRRAQGQKIVNAAQSLSRENALKMYTINNAYASFDEKTKGSLKVGKLADLVVLSEDLLICPAAKIKDIKPLMTIVGGKIVYNNQSLKIRN